MDLFIFQQINQWAGKWLWLDVLGIYLAAYLEYVLIFGVFLFLAINYKKYWRLFIAAFISAVFARLIIVELIRWLLPRPRPFVGNQVNLLLDHINSFSFPSGHASFYFAIAASIFLSLLAIKEKPKHWLKISFLFFLGALIIGIARIFAGIHWPSDILAGAVVGIFSAWLVNKIFKKFEKK